ALWMLTPRMFQTPLSIWVSRPHGGAHLNRLLSLLFPRSNRSPCSASEDPGDSLAEELPLLFLIITAPAQSYSCSYCPIRATVTGPDSTKHTKASPGGRINNQRPANQTQHM
ncbi:hypothetical protein KUCAC02_020404, partial [Chaenocephalus aceratus]